MTMIIIYFSVLSHLWHWRL